jgi:hypothetical protein
MTDFWIGSREWGRWWDPEPAHILRDVDVDGQGGVSLVELERTGERVLIARDSVPVVPGRGVGAIVYRAPDGWDGRTPLHQADLQFASEPELYARAEDAPVVSREHREKIRRGWAF